MQKSLSLCLFACAVVGCGSGGSESNKLAATAFGDTSHPATRGSPIDALQEACGSIDGLLGDTSMIARRPYLQLVTTSSASFGWVTNNPSNQMVEVTTPDGERVMVAAGVSEDGAVRTAGEKQMWSSTTTALVPDTIYCYRVLASDQPVTERLGFRTAPTADSTRTIGVLAFGDSGGGGNDQFALRDQMGDVPFEVAIHTGDLAYDNGTIDQIEDTVFAVYGDLFAHIPFFPAAGNHDYETMQGAPFRDVFKLPQTGTDEKWYSYDWGRIHFAALDTEADYATQARWLDADLAASPLPWKIVYLHRPPYSSGEHGSDLPLRNALAPILEKHHVQLLLAGHDHDYERMTPQRGVEYVVTGGGGRGTRPVGNSGFTAFAEEVIHYVYLEVGVDQLTLHAIDGIGVEFDSVVIAR
jgi:hypothetical protein